MTVRTTHSTVEFGASFNLKGFDEPLPAGSYQIATEEEALESTHRIAYRRISTTLRVENGGTIEYHHVDPAALDAAIERDRKACVSLKAHSADVVEEEVVPALLGRSPWRSIPMWVRNSIPGRRKS